MAGVHAVSLTGRRLQLLSWYCIDKELVPYMLLESIILNIIGRVRGHLRDQVLVIKVARSVEILLVLLCWKVPRRLHPLL